MFLFFSVRFDDCYLCGNLFAEHSVFIPRSSYLVLASLIASRRSLPRRRDAAILSYNECFSRHFPRMQRARAHDGGDRWLEDGWTELWKVGRAGKRAPRRQTPGAGCPRLGTTTAMFVGRNGRKREPSQGMGGGGGRAAYLLRIFEVLWTSTSRPVEKERPVVTGRREEKKGTPAAKCWRGVRDGISISGGEAISM